MVSRMTKDLKEEVFYKLNDLNPFEDLLKICISFHEIRLDPLETESQDHLHNQMIDIIGH